MGNCKCAHRRRGDTVLNVMVGDGRSDFCIAELCQLVIAKGSLLRRCQQNGLPHIAMSDFADANAQFAQWLSNQRTRAASNSIDAPQPEMLEANL
jgi:2-hydroxy-3-keto-5-methylthiopentenyl-1-phosphate phosphatase